LPVPKIRNSKPHCSSPCLQLIAIAELSSEHLPMDVAQRRSTTARRGRGPS
jgi:hypothetical protein